MKTQHFIATLVFFIAQLCSMNTYAQSIFYGVTIVPSNPTSDDNINFVRVEGAVACRRLEPTYKISMLDNHITITFGEWDKSIQITLPPPDSRYTDLANIGRLPPGDYTLTTRGPPCLSTFTTRQPDLQNFAFKVSEGKLTKGNLKPALDYSGHWWDENDPGWGLFIWQDGAGNMLAAWLTYTADGKPAWYVFQPTTWPDITSAFPVDVWQTSKPPGAISPPVGDAKLTKVGFAGLTFYFGNYNRGANSVTVEEFARFYYQLGNEPRQTRILMRFKAK